MPSSTPHTAVAGPTVELTFLIANMGLPVCFKLVTSSFSVFISELSDNNNVSIFLFCCINSLTITSIILGCKFCGGNIAVSPASICIAFALAPPTLRSNCACAASDIETTVGLGPTLGNGAACSVKANPEGYVDGCCCGGWEGGLGVGGWIGDGVALVGVHDEPPEEERGVPGVRLQGELSEDSGEEAHASMHSLKCSGNSENWSFVSSNKNRETSFSLKGTLLLGAKRGGGAAF